MPSSLEVNQGKGFSTLDRAGTERATLRTAPACAQGADITTGLLEEEIMSLFH